MVWSAYFIGLYAEQKETMFLKGIQPQHTCVLTCYFLFGLAVESSVYIGMSLHEPIYIQ